MPTRVLINGTDVGDIAQDSVIIEPGDRTSPATVALTLMPSRIEIKSRPTA